MFDDLGTYMKSHHFLSFSKNLIVDITDVSLKH